MDALVLAYGFSGNESKLLEAVCKKMSVRLRHAVPEEHALPIGQLCGLSRPYSPRGQVRDLNKVPGCAPGFRPAAALSEKLPPLSAAHMGVRQTLLPAIPGRMLVMAHFTDMQLDAFLLAIREASVGTSALKAVVTDINSKWSGYKLYTELVKEREGMG